MNYSILMSTFTYFSSLSKKIQETLLIGKPGIMGCRILEPLSSACENRVKDTSKSPDEIIGRVHYE